MIKIRQLKVDLQVKNINDIKIILAKRLNVKDSDIENIFIRKKSLDARDKNNIHYSYEIDIISKREKEILKKHHSMDISLTQEEKYTLPLSGDKKLLVRPIIVGSGPSGLFAAYILAEKGYRPLIIERGEKIEDRIKSVEKFWETGFLNVESNVCFGEGGAGTFSDGKLNTLVKDKKNRILKIFTTFVECGAPEEIMYESKPHIGTDLLRNVIINMRKKIMKMGGDFLYNAKLSDIIVKNEEIKYIEINNQKLIPCELLVLAIGHSAKDTYKMLYEKKMNMTTKPFAIGIRIQHPQAMINNSQYGNIDNILPSASYKLTYTTSKNRGVYSFCMCPGGYVINASSEEQCLVINGMSNHERDEKNANSAIVVTVTEEDIGKNPMEALEYQSNLELIAYKKGNGSIPVQLWKDFNENTISKIFHDVKPVFKGKYTFANLNEILPTYICDALKEAIPYFDKKIKGFARDDAIIAGIESRTSSPVRIERDENLMSNIKGIYPIGEGAGYAGGITTSAIDGIKVAEKIIEEYSFIQ